MCPPWFAVLVRLSIKVHWPPLGQVSSTPGHLYIWTLSLELLDSKNKTQVHFGDVTCHQQHVDKTYSPLTPNLPKLYLLLPFWPWFSSVLSLIEVPSDILLTNSLLLKLPRLCLYCLQLRKTNSCKRCRPSEMVGCSIICLWLPNYTSIYFKTYIKVLKEQLKWKWILFETATRCRRFSQEATITSPANLLCGENVGSGRWFWCSPPRRV